MPLPYRPVVASFAFLAAACGGGPKPVDPGDVKGPGPIDPPPLHLPGVAYADVHCERKVDADCNFRKSFDLHIVGNKLNSCRITPDANPGAAAGTSIVSLIINNAVDAKQSISISFRGYTGTGRYQVAQVGQDYVTLSQSLSLPAWEYANDDHRCPEGSYSGPASGADYTISTPDASCGAGHRCEVTVDDRNPTVSPREVKFHVTCEAMCINNRDDVVCRAPAGGPQFIEFDFTASDCTG